MHIACWHVLTTLLWQYALHNPATHQQKPNAVDVTPQRTAVGLPSIGSKHVINLQGSDMKLVRLAVLLRLPLGDSVCSAEVHTQYCIMLPSQPPFVKQPQKRMASFCGASLASRYTSLASTCSPESPWSLACRRKA